MQNLLLELDAALKALAQRALEGQCLPDELTGGTFTVTNLGMYGVEAFTPIIQPAGKRHLGRGQHHRQARRPSGRDRHPPDDDAQSGFDHRLIDGAPAARFLQRITHLLEHPVALVL